MTFRHQLWKAKKKKDKKKKKKAKKDKKKKEKAKKEAERAKAALKLEKEKAKATEKEQKEKAKAEEASSKLATTLGDAALSKLSPALTSMDMILSHAMLNQIPAMVRDPLKACHERATEIKNKV